MRDRYDVIVIGGGHAGTEAAWAAAGALADRADSHRRDAGATSPTVALITMDPAKIGMMSCNPAIGGLAKGQIVREIDALGGIMGRAIDATGIMFKMLNVSKGPAVRGPRAQADKYAYLAEVQRLIASHPGIEVIDATVDDIIVEHGRVVGVMVPAGAGVVHSRPDRIERHVCGEEISLPIYDPAPSDCARAAHPTMIRADAIVLTTGTFMRALMHTGEVKTIGGRVGEGSAGGISTTLKRLGFELGRLKTGTPPRLDRESIDWDGLPEQIGDEVPAPFSDYLKDWDKETRTGGTPVPPLETRTGKMPVPLPETSFPRLPQIECRVTETTAFIHEAIRANLHRAPMYSGQIEAECGPRYCPSIEDKVVRFADRPSHHVFLEPESLHTNEIYCNGISTSLPPDVQEIIVRGMPGCARARILRWGYAVEYDMVRPHQIDSTGMTKSIHGLFLAGQINGTSGYEEAGGQGLLAGLNAARFARGDEPVRLGRDQAYIGVMLDDLVTRTPREPYRMFTSRAEYRLLLRADNADVRLTPLARAWGLIDDPHWASFEHRRAALEAISRQLGTVYIEGKSLREIVRRPETTPAEVMAGLNGVLNHVPPREAARLIDRAMTEVRYEGYITRQHAEIRRQAEADQRSIPGWLRPSRITGLRKEAAEVLERFRPATMGQAGRLPGVNPADLTLLAVAIRRGPAHSPISAG